MYTFRSLIVLTFLLLGARSAAAAVPLPIDHPIHVNSDAATSVSREMPADPTTPENQDIVLPPGDRRLRINRGRRRKRGAIYARFSTDFQASIKDQVRACQEWADANDVEIDPTMIFIDEGVSGKKSRRAGLNKLKAALDEGRIDVLVAFTTNRLHRNSYKARQFIEEDVLENNARCVCIRSGVDTIDGKKWRLLHGVNALVDETVIAGTADQVREAHVGLLLAGKVFGTVTYGYAGEVIPGAFTKLLRPQRRLIVDPINSVWVKTIFVWYVNDELSIATIVIKLRESNAPVPNLCRDGWTALAVRRLLSNQRYIGIWSYGATKTRWLSKKDYGLQERQKEPMKSQAFPDRRIIDDVLFARAQERLAGRNTCSGRKPSNGVARPRILNGIFWCTAHQRFLYYSNGFFCPECRRSSTPALFSKLSADLALTLICQRLADAVQADGELPTTIAALFRSAAEAQGRPDMSQLPALERREEQLAKNIAAILRNLGDSEDDAAQSESLLAERRGERVSVQRQIAELKQLADRPIKVPTEDEAREMVSQMYTALLAAATGNDPTDALLLRQIILDLTGGKIECVQAGEAKMKAGWIRGQFKLHLLTPFTKGVTVTSESPEPDPAQVVIDFKEPPALTERAELVKSMVDQGLMMAEIAIKLGLQRNQITVALHHWYESRGLTAPDGRARRSTLTKKHLTPPLYQTIAPKVMELVKTGKLLYTIASELNVDRNTITQAIDWWHTSQGLPAPDGRGRRKTLDHKSKPYRPRRRRGEDGEPPRDDLNAA